MWKTVSEACNLACDYCYYSSCKGRPEKLEVISVEVLKKFIKEYMEKSNGIAVFAWQGGEPLLAGLDFFEKVVSLQAEYAPKNTVISNSIQTNGTLIDENWARFFKKYNFLVGVSLDGPKDINDARRVTGSGVGSFQSIMKGIGQLKAENVDFNILTVLHEDNIDKARELMEFYERENFRFVQFIPCMDFKSQDINRPGKYLITQKEYGDFLCNVFDLWYKDGLPETSIGFFDNMLAVYLHEEAHTCTHRESCPKTLVLEQNGDAYPCDFYIHNDYNLGNIFSSNLETILNHSKLEGFLNKKKTLPKQCESCEYLQLCNGGCPRNRNWYGDLNLQTDFFCQSYKQIYKYADQRMRKVAKNEKARKFEKYIRSGRVLPGRNDMCLCGSGEKFKKCCEPLKQVINL